MAKTNKNNLNQSIISVTALNSDHTISVRIKTQEDRGED